LDAKYVAVGSPTLNSQMMPNVSGFLTYMKGLSPKQNNVNRIGIAFGSYGWAPVGPKNIHAELTSVGFKMPLPPLARNWLPDQAYFDDVRKQIRELVRAQ
jgi:flavorubredoxin